MHDLLRRVERQQPAGRLDGQLPPTCLDLRAEQLAEDGDHLTGILPALHLQPAVECFQAAGEAGEQGTGVEIGRRADRRQRLRCREGVESHHVDFDDLPLQPQRPAVVPEQVGRNESQRELEVTGERRRHIHIAVDKEGGEVLDRALAFHRQCQEGDERLRASIADRQRVAAVVDG